MVWFPISGISLHVAPELFFPYTILPLGFTSTPYTQASKSRGALKFTEASVKRYYLISSIYEELVTYKGSSFFLKIRLLNSELFKLSSLCNVKRGPRNRHRMPTIRANTSSQSMWKQWMGQWDERQPPFPGRTSSCVLPKAWSIERTANCCYSLELSTQISAPRIFAYYFPWDTCKYESCEDVWFAALYWLKHVSN